MVGIDLVGHAVRIAAAVVDALAVVHAFSRAPVMDFHSEADVAVVAAGAAAHTL